MRSEESNLLTSADARREAVALLQVLMKEQPNNFNKGEMKNEIQRLYVEFG